MLELRETELTGLTDELRDQHTNDRETIYQLSNENKDLSLINRETESHCRQQRALIDSLQIE